MLKRLLFISLFSICIHTLQAQTLKVTDVKATVDKLYDFAAQTYLGKTMVLTVYDNSATIELPRNEKLILRKTASGNYTYLESTTEKEVHLFILTIEKTVGVISSVQLQYNINEKAGQRRHASWTIIGKRF